MPIQQLPYEILENIFRILYLNPYSNRNMRNCTLVCKSWSLPARRVYFEKLCVRYISQTIKLLTSQNENMGALCKVLRLDGFCATKERPSEQYQQLLSCLPSLQTIIVETNFDQHQHFHQIARHAQLIKHVKKILLEGELQAVDFKSYYRCVNIFKTTLQNVLLNAMGETHYFDGSYGNTIAFLSTLTSLTSLRIENYKNSPTQLTMFTILRTCPNLINFFMINAVREPEEEDINKIFDHSKLKSMDIALPELTKHHISYMIANITQLERLCIDCGHSSNSEGSMLWAKKIGPDLLESFQKYLSNIEKVSFYTFGDIKLSMAEYWLFVSGIIANNRSTPTHISFKIDDHISDTKVLSIDPTKIDLHIGMNTDDFLQIAESSTSQVLFAPSELNKNNVQSFSMRFEPRLEGDKFHRHVSKILEPVLNTFKNLSKVTMETNKYCHSNFKIEVASNEIIDYTTCHSIMSLLIRRRPTSFPLEKLSYAALKILKSTKEITSALEFFPTIKHLRLLDCKLTSDNNFSINLDLNNLKLQQLTLKITDLLQENNDVNPILLQIKEKQTNRISYFKGKRDNRELDNLLFEPIKQQHLTEDRRYASSKINTVLIKCNSLEQIRVHVDLKERHNSVTATVNL